MAPVSSSSPKPHIAFFPFMSKGHTIPILHLARLLLQRHAAVTIFTTPANHPFISQSLAGAADHVSIVDLPFPENIPGIPPGTESTDKLSSMSLLVDFFNGIKLMKPSFDEALQKIHSQVTCLVSDGFLPWTLEPASRLGIPRVSFYGMNHYATALSFESVMNGLLWLHESADEPFALPSFPWIKLTRNDFDEPFSLPDPRGPYVDFIMETNVATKNSYGLLMNSFYELEKPFADYTSRERKINAWNVGPLCLAEPAKESTVEVSSDKRPRWMSWLDEKLAQGSPVLYVAFGSQAKISPKQLKEISRGLEEAGSSFLWVVKKSEGEALLSIAGDGFEERVKERGMVVREWVDQKVILEHPIVKGFVSHCGWNSVLEGICAEVPIVAWPMMAEQFLNARMVSEEIKIGVRVSTVDGSVKGFVKGESLREVVMEVMEGEKGKELRERVKEVAAAARRAVADGGSSSVDLDRLIEETCKQRDINVRLL